MSGPRTHRELLYMLEGVGFGGVWALLSTNLLGKGEIYLIFGILVIVASLIMYYYERKQRNYE